MWVRVPLRIFFRGLAEWITPAILILGFLYLDQSIRNVRTELREGLRDASRERTELRDRMGRIEERMARLEGALDVLREFFIGSGRGTAA